MCVDSRNINICPSEWYECQIRDLNAERGNYQFDDEIFASSCALSWANSMHHIALFLITHFLFVVSSNIAKCNWTDCEIFKKVIKLSNKVARSDSMITQPPIDFRRSKIVGKVHKVIRHHFSFMIFHITHLFTHGSMN